MKKTTPKGFIVIIAVVVLLLICWGCYMLYEKLGQGSNNLIANGEQPGSGSNSGSNANNSNSPTSPGATPPTISPAPGANTGGSTPSQGNPVGFPLVNGSRGDMVKQLQIGLNNWIAATGIKTMSKLVVDGIFGAKTLAAVKARFGSSIVNYSQFIDLKF